MVRVETTFRQRLAARRGIDPLPHELTQEGALALLRQKTAAERLRKTKADASKKNNKRRLPDQVTAGENLHGTETIATAQDITDRIVYQDDRYRSLERANRLTPQWVIYGNRRSISRKTHEEAFAIFQNSRK